MEYLKNYNGLIQDQLVQELIINIIMLAFKKIQPISYLEEIDSMDHGMDILKMLNFSIIKPYQPQ